jgi:branched-chain amino acid transport system permease protein
VFVVVVFGGRSLAGAFIASLFSARSDFRGRAGLVAAGPAHTLWREHSGGLGLAPGAVISVAQAAPVLPYLLMVLMLIVRPTRAAGDA